MNVKKIFENKIRGWFPQEPKMLHLSDLSKGSSKSFIDKLKSRADTSGWIVFVLGLTFATLGISFQFLVGNYAWGNGFMLIAIVLAFVLAFLQYRRQNRLKRKQTQVV
jgi:hypothetical protein